MGRRSSRETTALVFQAFLESRTWRQAELARRTELSVKGLKGVLDELSRMGMPLEREEDDGQVYWSVPPSWFPGAVKFTREEAGELAEHLLRLPRSEARDRFLTNILAASPSIPGLAKASSAVVTHELSREEAEMMSTLQRAVMLGQAVRLHYYTASRRALENRVLTVLRVLPGPPARFVAVCHRDETMKWFRVDNAMSGCMAGDVEPRVRDDEEVARFIAESVDGFHESTEVEEHVFFVTSDASAWVRRNLLPPMTAESEDDGLRVRCKAAGPLRIARYVVGLGGAARPETEALRLAVAELAQAALRTSKEGPHSVMTREPEQARSRN